MVEAITIDIRISIVTKITITAIILTVTATTEIIEVTAAIQMADTEIKRNTIIIREIQTTISAEDLEGILENKKK